jgi:serine/threonine protein kinase
MEDKYKIIKVIATGGMATIYEGEQISLSRPVIIKKLHPHLAQDRELVQRFEREAKILGGLNHKNIVEIIDFYKKDGDYFIVLEFIKGRSLKELVREIGRLPVPIATFICSQIAAGLSAAHKKGILHRDIKPANIMISDDGVVKISDFGLALALQGTEITEPGATIGTPAYLPPELIRGEKATPRSDIYSLGILYYEILSGANPFEGKNRFDTINNVLYKKLPPLVFKNDAEDKPVASIVARMTKSDPKLRYGSADSILSDLMPHSSATQKDLVRFLQNPTPSDALVPARNTFRPGVLIYSIVLAGAITVFLSMIIGNWRIKTISRKLQSSVAIDTTANDSLGVLPDTITTAMLDSIPVQDPLSHKSNADTGDSPSTPAGFGFVKPIIKPWAQVYIGDEYYGSTPLSHPIRLAAGNHILTFKHPNRKDYTKSITLSPDETLGVFVTLEEVFGFLKISVSPWAEILIDGDSKGITPIAQPLRLTAGTHVLELKKDDMIQWKNTVTIPMDDTLKKTIVLR